MSGISFMLMFYLFSLLRASVDQDTTIINSISTQTTEALVELFRDYESPPPYSDEEFPTVFVHLRRSIPEHVPRSLHAEYIQWWRYADTRDQVVIVYPCDDFQPRRNRRTSRSNWKTGVRSRKSVGGRRRLQAEEDSNENKQTE